MEAAGVKTGAVQTAAAASETATAVAQPSDKKQQTAAEPKPKPVRHAQRRQVEDLLGHGE